jgi:hypothetical protein
MFEKWKLDSHIKKSADAFQRFSAEKAAAEKAFAEGEVLQPDIEAVFLQRFACEQTGGSPGRLRDLTVVYKAKLAERDGPRTAGRISLDKAAAEVRATTEPAIRWASTWIRQMMAAAPVNDEFSRLCLAAIHDLEAMSLRPLADVMKVIEKHQAEIEGYDFGQRIEKPLPALSIQALGW